MKNKNKAIKSSKTSQKTAKVIKTGAKTEVKIVKIKNIGIPALIDRVLAYIHGAERHIKTIKRFYGVTSTRRLESSVKKIDKLGDRIEKLELAMNNLRTKRNLEAMDLDKGLRKNMKLVKAHFDVSDQGDFE